MTIIHFDEVAAAIAECAFVTSELPVILSLEMHCTPKQQNKLAKSLVSRLGNTLMAVRCLMLFVCPPHVRECSGYCISCAV